MGFVRQGKAGNVQRVFSFTIDYPKVRISVNGTPKLGQTITIFGSTNIAPTDSICDDETPNNITIFIDSQPYYVLNVPWNRTFQVQFRIPENWSYGIHMIKAVAYTNSYFYGDSYAWIEIINPEWKNIDVLNTTEISVTRGEIIRIHGNTTRDLVCVYADNASVFYDVNQLPSNENFSWLKYPSLMIRCSDNAFVTYLEVNPEAPLGNHTLYFFATNNTTINQQTDLLAKIGVIVHAVVISNFTVYPEIVNITNPLNIEADISGINLKKVDIGIIDINGVMSDHVVLAVVTNESGVSGHYSVKQFPGPWTTHVFYANSEPVTVLINQSEPWFYIPAYYRNSTLDWTEAMLALNTTTLKIEFIGLNVSGWTAVQPGDGEVKLRIFKVPTPGQLIIENSSIIDLSSLEIERRVAKDGVYLVYIYAEDHFGGNVTEIEYVVVDNSAITLPPLPGLAKPPKDLNGDGLIEDFNGNGRLDFDDVVKLYKNMKWIRENYPVNLVDLSRDGKIDFSDVVELFKKL